MSPDSFPHAGAIVRIRDARWRVESRVSHNGVIDLRVAGLDHDQRGRRASFLLPFDRCEMLPHDDRPRRVRRAEWLRVARRVLADATPAWQSLRCAVRARVSIIPFQLEPALALVSRRTCRVLIADAVGLGKTIQAGLMIAETLERTADGRALVIVPAGLREQWAGELRDRFSLAATLLDATSAPRAAAGMVAGSNPWATLPLTITSIDYIKRPDVIRALEGLVWDLIVFDEAHALTGRSDRASAAAALANRARSVVMLTATPHSGDEAAFERLRTIGDLNGLFPLTVFRRTRDALGATAPRRVQHLRVRLTAAEHAMHLGLERYARLVWNETDAPGARLAVAVLRGRASSCATSLATSIERRLTWLSNASDRVPIEPFLPFDDVPDDDTMPDSELRAPAFADRNAELACLRELLALAANAALDESKLRCLRRLLGRIHDTAIVFTQYRDTLATLAGVLGAGHAVLHGGLTSSERRDQARRFTHGDARLLLATDAASEGLNLQHRCRLVVHLEMPWTPTRLEQRIGRVDRLGQHRRVHSIHLIASGSTEDDVTRRMLERRERSERALAEAADDSPNEPVAGDALPPSSDTVAVDPAFLRAECIRIDLARQLASRAATTIPVRPLVTTLRRSCARTTWVMRVPFIAASGDIVWESILAIVSPRAHDTHPDALIRSAGGRHALQSHVGQQLVQLRGSVSAAVESLLARENAIARELTVHRARLSAALLQRGLFEHRGERLASAQDEVLRVGLDRVTARVEALEQMRRIDAAEPVGLFGASSSR